LRFDKIFELVGAIDRQIGVKTLSLLVVVELEATTHIRCVYIIKFEVRGKSDKELFVILNILRFVESK
jgi:hypothetical protein